MTARTYAQITKAVETLINGDPERAAMVFRAATLIIAHEKGPSFGTASAYRIAQEVRTR